MNIPFLDPNRRFGLSVGSHFHLSVLSFDPLPVWEPDLSLESLSHAAAGREGDWHKCSPSFCHG
jgi:hypothetical protein